MRKTLIAGLVMLSCGSAIGQVELSGEKSNFKNYTTINYSAGIGMVNRELDTIQNTDYILGMHTINGFQINDYFYAGFSIGFERTQKEIYLPFSINTLFTLSKGKTSPVTGFSIGKALNLNEPDDNRTQIQFNYGFKTKVSEKSDFIFQLGYKWNIERGDLIPTGYFKSYYQFVTFSAGFSL